MSITERLRSLREECKVNQDELADMLHIGQNTYSQYETGKRNIPNETLVALADCLNTTTDYILGRTDNAH